MENDTKQYALDFSIGKKPARALAVPYNEDDFPPTGYSIARVYLPDMPSAVAEEGVFVVDELADEEDLKLPSAVDRHQDCNVTWRVTANNLRIKHILTSRKSHATRLAPCCRTQRGYRRGE